MNLKPCKKAVKSNFMPKPKAHTKNKTETKTPKSRVKSLKRARGEGRVRMETEASTHWRERKKLHQNPIIRGELRKTVINVLSILTFISCQNGSVHWMRDTKITREKRKSILDVIWRRDSRHKDAFDKNNNMPSHEFIQTCLNLHLNLVIL